MGHQTSHKGACKYSGSTGYLRTTLYVIPSGSVVASIAGHTAMSLLMHSAFLLHLVPAHNKNTHYVPGPYADHMKGGFDHTPYR